MLQEQTPATAIHPSFQEGSSDQEEGGQDEGGQEEGGQDEGGQSKFFTFTQTFNHS